MNKIYQWYDVGNYKLILLDRKLIFVIVVYYDRKVRDSTRYLMKHLISFLFLSLYYTGNQLFIAYSMSVYKHSPMSMGVFSKQLIAD